MAQAKAFKDIKTGELYLPTWQVVQEYGTNRTQLDNLAEAGKLRRKTIEANKRQWFYSQSDLDALFRVAVDPEPGDFLLAG